MWHVQVLTFAEKYIYTQSFLANLQFYQITNIVN